uniref:Acyltransferase C-terminal domain-containing protein n=1 Tax=Xenopus tropicalis TaxID=8364 RepID=A0A803JNR0_XENTR
MGFWGFLKTQFVVHLLIGFVFVVSGLINPTSCPVCTLPLWASTKPLYRRVNCRMSYLLWSQLVMLLEWWSGTQCTLFTDQEPSTTLGRSTCVQLELAAPLLAAILPNAICPLQSSKVLAKKELLMVPTICYRHSLQSHLFLLLPPPHPYLLRSLYPCAQFLMEVADKKGLARLKHHLLPRYQRLHYCISAVYDKYEADMCVRRFPLEEIPEDDPSLSQDALQEAVHSGRDLFPGTQIVPPRRPWTLLNFLFWATLLLSPLFSFAIGACQSVASALFVLTHIIPGASAFLRYTFG